MKKLLILPFLLISFAAIQAQETTEIMETKKWNDTINASLLFNQSAFNAEWAGGGTSNIAADAVISYQFNYNSSDWILDNTFLDNYGITKNEDIKYKRKTSDML